MEIKYIKSAARVLNRDCVNKRGLDLSKNVLWVSVGQGAADLRAVKVGGLKKISAIRPGVGYSGSRPAARPDSNPSSPRWAEWPNFFSNLHL